MTEQSSVDVVNRDPNELNSEIKVAFEDVFGEPDSTHSFDFIWKSAYLCFTYGKNCCYKFMTTLCGLCIALYWGCEFALITFNVVWCCTPSLKAYTAVVEVMRRFFSLCIQCCLGPVCEAFGMCFSRITVTNISK